MLLATMKTVVRLILGAAGILGLIGVFSEVVCDSKT